MSSTLLDRSSTHTEKTSSLLRASVGYLSGDSLSVPALFPSRQERTCVSSAAFLRLNRVQRHAGSRHTRARLWRVPKCAHAQRPACISVAVGSATDGMVG